MTIIGRAEVTRSTTIRENTVKLRRGRDKKIWAEVTVYLEAVLPGLITKVRLLNIANFL